MTTLRSVLGYVLVAMLVCGEKSAEARKLTLKQTGLFFESMQIIVDGESIDGERINRIRQITEFQLPDFQQPVVITARSKDRVSNSIIVPPGTSDLVGCINAKKLQPKLRLYSEIANSKVQHVIVDEVSWGNDDETQITYSESFEIEDGSTWKSTASYTSEDWLVTVARDSIKRQFGGQLGSTFSPHGEVDAWLLEAGLDLDFQAHINRMVERYCHRDGILHHRIKLERGTELTADGNVWKSGRVKRTDVVRKGLTTAVINGKRYELEIKIFVSTHLKFEGLLRNIRPEEDANATIGASLRRTGDFLDDMEVASPQSLKIAGAASLFTLFLLIRVVGAARKFFRKVHPLPRQSEAAVTEEPFPETSESVYKVVA